MVVCFGGSPKRMEEEMGEYLPPDPPLAEKCNLHTHKTGYVTLFSLGEEEEGFSLGEKDDLQRRCCL